MADNLQREASQLLQWRAEGKVSFLGDIFRPDGIINMEELMAAREKWRVTRTVRTNSGRVIELPHELSEWDCNSGSLRAFYAQYPEAVDTVIYSPGERFKEALARQPDDIKRVRTIIIQRRMIQTKMNKICPHFGHVPMVVPTGKLVAFHPVLRILSWFCAKRRR